MDGSRFRRRSHHRIMMFLVLLLMFFGSIPPGDLTIPPPPHHQAHHGPSRHQPSSRHHDSINTNNNVNNKSRRPTLDLFSHDADVVGGGRKPIYTITNEEHLDGGWYDIPVVSGKAVYHGKGVVLSPVSKIKQQLTMMDHNGIDLSGVKYRKRGLHGNKKRTSSSPRRSQTVTGRRRHRRSLDELDTTSLVKLINMITRENSGDDGQSWRPITPQQLQNILTKELSRRQHSQPVQSRSQPQPVPDNTYARPNPLDKDVDSNDWVLLDPPTKGHHVDWIDKFWEREDALTNHGIDENEVNTNSDDNDVIKDTSGELEQNSVDVGRDDNMISDEEQEELRHDDDLMTSSQVTTNNMATSPQQPTRHRGLSLHPDQPQEEPILLESIYESLKYEPSTSDLLSQIVAPKIEDELLANDEQENKGPFGADGFVDQVVDQSNRADSPIADAAIGDEVIERRPMISWSRGKNLVQWLSSDKRTDDDIALGGEDSMNGLDSPFTNDIPSQFGEELPDPLMYNNDNNDWFHSKRIDVKKPGPRFPPPTIFDDNSDGDTGSNILPSDNNLASQLDNDDYDINRDLSSLPIKLFNPDPDNDDFQGQNPLLSNNIADTDDLSELLKSSSSDDDDHRTSAEVHPTPGHSRLVSMSHSISEATNRRIAGDYPIDNKTMSAREQRILMTYAIGIFVGLIAFLVGAMVIVVRRHEIFRRKLMHLLGHFDITDTMSAYQDLCRQRMQSSTKENSEINPNDSEGKPTTTTSSTTLGTSGVGGCPAGPSGIRKSSIVGPSGSPAKHQSLSLSSESGSSSGTMTVSGRSSTSSWCEEMASCHMDISTGHMILSYMEDHLKNRDRLNREWEEICSYEPDRSSISIGSSSSNRRRNRYLDIIPYDHTRIVLGRRGTSASGGGSVKNSLKSSIKSTNDYINANAIIDADPKNPTYIATQGPLQNTTNDFWQMIWEQESHTIVMLTRCTENGVALCYRYWPDSGSSSFGSFEVHVISEHFISDDYVVRSFVLKNSKSNESRSITHFQYLTWPEKSVPTNGVRSLLEFRRKVNKSIRCQKSINTPPIVVHCSDGSGRTGTYILIDMVLNRMSKGAKEIDIAATLEHLRDQRLEMVRSLEQFEFVLKAIAEEVHMILRSLQASETASSGPGHGNATVPAMNY